MANGLSQAWAQFRSLLPPNFDIAFTPSRHEQYVLGHLALYASSTGLIGSLALVLESVGAAGSLVEQLCKSFSAFLGDVDLRKQIDLVSGTPFLPEDIRLTLRCQIENSIGDACESHGKILHKQGYIRIPNTTPGDLERMPAPKLGRWFLSGIEDRTMTFFIQIAKLQQLLEHLVEEDVSLMTVLSQVGKLNRLVTLCALRMRPLADDTALFLPFDDPSESFVTALVLLLESAFLTAEGEYPELRLRSLWRYVTARYIWIFLSNTRGWMEVGSEEAVLDFERLIVKVLLREVPTLRRELSADRAYSELLAETEQSPQNKKKKGSKSKRAQQQRLVAWHRMSMRLMHLMQPEFHDASVQTDG